MAKQIGIIKLRGTIGNITYFKREGEYYAKGKSSLSGERVKKNPEFEQTMFHAKLLGRASQIASKVYNTIPINVKKYEMFRALTGEAMRLLKDGKTDEEAWELLLKIVPSLFSPSHHPPI